MKRISIALLAIFVFSIIAAGCGPTDEGDPRASTPNTAPSSTPGTTSGSTKNTPGGTPSPGSTAGGSGTGTTAPTDTTG
jgi:hypothetical protein